MTARETRDTRKLVDLEELVAWAIRDQKAHRDNTALHAVESAAHMSMRSRRGGRADGYAFAGGWGMDSCARIAAIGNIGTRIDGGGPTRGVAPRLHPDAEAVTTAMGRLPWRQRGLIIEFGSIGEAPPWSNGKQRLVRVPVSEIIRGPLRHKVLAEWMGVMTRFQFANWRRARGLPIVDRYGRSIVTDDVGIEFRYLEDGQRQAKVKHCPLQFDPSDEWIERTNGVYATWHAGMTALLDSMTGLALKDHRITGFAAQAEPWL
ncbi:hypothetical protein [Azospirillum argentinense]|uniref:hypothetical protein n=1 Tax=Azospirillum argentinense TaxID=2970906 RepID=UPI0032DF98F1